MNEITRQRCFNHLGREAVARCPECARFFCRECITEHEDRVVCAACLKTSTAAVEKTRRYAGLFLLTRCAFGFLTLWLLFFTIGRLLQLIPTSFHEGNLWRNLPWQNW